MCKYQNTRIFFLKVSPQIGQKKILWLEKFKILYHRPIRQKTLMAERLLSLELKMCSKKVNYVLSGKVIITRLIAG